MKPENEQKLKAIFGDPLPELDPIYYEGVKFLIPGSANDEIVPYTFYGYYTPDEMKMVAALPGTTNEVGIPIPLTGTAEDVAAATGFDPVYVSETFNRLVKHGKLMLVPGGYQRHAPITAVYQDLAFFAEENQGNLLTNDNVDLKNMVKLWHAAMTRKETDVGRVPMRIIPKWRAVKDIPGLMDCENMKELMLSYNEKGQLTYQRCICRVNDAVKHDRDYDPAEGLKKDKVSDGNSSREGHCLMLGPLAQYQVNVYGAPTYTNEELMQKLDESESVPVVYVAPNNREGGNVCNCTFRVCVPFTLTRSWKHVPSRFAATHNESKCVRCLACKEICPFGAISFTDGRIDVHSELCMGCGNCAVKCPTKAKTMELVRPANWIPGGPEDEP